MNDDLAARMIEAAARKLRDQFFDCLDSPGMIATSDAMARAALAAAVREAGLDAAELVDAATEAEAEAEREMLLDIGDHVLTGKVARLLRALGGIVGAE